MSSGPSRSSADPFDVALADAADGVLRAVVGLRAPVVLVDGRSGSGKTTLARRVAERADAPMQVIALDDLYPGWDGLDAGVAEVVLRVLRPRGNGGPALWRRWDWGAGEWAEEHEVPSSAALLVEGSGVVTPETAGLADLTVWLESPDASRRKRALARDGDLYRPHWDRWAAQEHRHVDRDHPREIADLVFEIP